MVKSLKREEVCFREHSQESENFVKHKNSKSLRQETPFLSRRERDSSEVYLGKSYLVIKEQKWEDSKDISNLNE